MVCGNTTPKEFLNYYANDASKEDIIVQLDKSVAICEDQRLNIEKLERYFEDSLYDNEIAHNLIDDILNILNKTPANKEPTILLNAIKLRLEDCKKQS